MEVIELKEIEFQDVIKKGKVVVDCYATWCGPCKMMAPIIEEVAKENDSCSFYKLDIDQAEKLAKEYGIMSIPTLLLFQDGKLIDKSIGLISKEDLVNFIK